MVQISILWYWQKVKKKPQVIISGKETAAKEKMIEKHGSNRGGIYLSRLDLVPVGCLLLN